MRVGSYTVAIVPLEDHVTECEPFSLFPRVPTIDLANDGPLLGKTAPPSRIRGDFRRCWAFHILSVTRVTWVTILIINGFSGEPRCRGLGYLGSSIALGFGTVTPVTFGTAARVTSAAAPKAAEKLGFGVSVTLVTLVTADSVGAPAHAAKRLAGIVPPRTADYPGRQDIEPHRAMLRDFDRLRRFAVAGGDDQPALDHSPCQCRSIKALGDLAPPLLRQHHVFPAAVVVTAAEP